jgi:hypothetical protein
MNLCEAQLPAYAFPYRRFAAALAGVRARLRVDADRYSLTLSDLHRLLLAGFSGALRKNLHATHVDRWHCGLAAARTEHIGSPALNLIGVNVELLGQLRQCPIALDRGKRNLRLKAG